MDKSVDGLFQNIIVFHNHQQYNNKKQTINVARYWSFIYDGAQAILCHKCIEENTYTYKFHLVGYENSNLWNFLN